MEIGFIGLGHMGQAMARSLLRAGHGVVVWNRTRARAESLRAAGARIADDIAGTCGGDAVITMIANDAAVEEVASGEHGVLEALAAYGGVHVSMSTISPSLVRSLAERHRARHQNFLSAPVLGRPAVAAEGKLSVLAAGDPALIAAVQPAFDVIGQRTFVVGAVPEAANLVKVSCNAMIAMVIEAVGETLALVTRSGIVDPATYIEVLLATVLGTPLYQPYGEHILRREFAPGFKLPLALKDMEARAPRGLPARRGAAAREPAPRSHARGDRRGRRRARLVGAVDGRAARGRPRSLTRLGRVI